VCAEFDSLDAGVEVFAKLETEVLAWHGTGVLGHFIVRIKDMMKCLNNMSMSTKPLVGERFLSEKDHGSFATCESTLDSFHKWCRIYLAVAQVTSLVRHTFKDVATIAEKQTMIKAFRRSMESSTNKGNINLPACIESYLTDIEKVSADN
jgi:hypothetical protein